MKSHTVTYQRPLVTAEVGCNHGGQLDNALELIQFAKEAGAYAVKFQKRDNSLLSPEQFNAPHPKPENAFADSYGRHREFLEFNPKQHRELKRFCENINIVYACSAWDINSAEQLISIQPEFIKVPSACNTNFKLLKKLIFEFSGDIHLSLGMTTRAEIESIASLFIEYRANHRLILYACTSGYPVPDKDTALLEIKSLHERYASRVRAIGFSGHHLGTALDIAAYVLGATWIERHFTKDCTLKGTDHAASLEPSTLKELVKGLNSVHSGLCHKKPDILPIEQTQHEKLKKIYDSLGVEGYDLSPNN